MIDHEHLARLEAAADARRAVLASLTGQAADLDARRAALEARRIRAALPADGLPGASVAAADLADIDAELSALAGLADATAAKVASERTALAAADEDAARLRSIEALALACEAKADALAALSDAWSGLAAAADGVLSAAAAVARAVRSEHDRDGGRARYWPALLAASDGMPPSRRHALDKLAHMVKDARREIAQSGARLATLPTLEADALRALPALRKVVAA